MPSVSQGTTEYRIAQHVAARVVGLLVVAVAGLVFVATGLIAFLDLHTAWLVVPAVIGLLLVVAAATTLSRRGWVLRLTDEGYRVQWVRGVGVDSARWRDVADAVTDTVAGSPVVRLHLKEGGSSTIPVEMMATDREEFVRVLQRYLRDGQGLRPWTAPESTGSDSPDPPGG